MATPIISTLRRNQGYILAVMGVVLIITWVIGPAALDFFGGGSQGRRPAAPVVVQWTKGGSTQFLTEGDLMHLRQEHMAVLEFVQRIVKKTVAANGTPQAPGLNLTPNPRTGEISIGLPLDTSETTVVNILLFAEKGREMGVRVDKAAMVSYLNHLSDFGMKEGDFVDVAKETVNEALEKGQVISVDSLFSALRKELVAQQAVIMTRDSVMNVSTGELWDLHKQLNLRYKIEAYPIDVEKLKANFKAADAKPDELMVLFNKGKDRVPNPDLPEPGFKTPHRIAFGYLTVDFEVFLAQAKKNVKDEKALERYTKGIAQGEFRKPKPLPEKPKETKPGEAKPGEEKPGEEKPAEPEKKEEGKPGEPKAEEKPAEEKPAAEKPGEKPADKEEAKPAAEKPAEEKPAEEKPVVEKPVAVVCDDEPATTPKSEEEKPADKEPAKSEPSTEEKKAKTEGEKSEGEKTDPAKTPEATPGEKLDDPAKTEKKEIEEIEHKSFLEVRDEILTALAQPEAVQLRDAAVQQAMDELRAYAAKLNRFEEGKQAKETDLEDPGEFRPEAFAKKYRFAYGKTNLVDRHQAASTVLGQNAIMPGMQGSLGFSEFAFFGKFNLYDPQEAAAIGETKYIFWRTNDQPEQEAELEKDGSFPPALKAQVEQAWLKQKAFEAAKKRAEELVAKVKGSSLREVVGKGEDVKVVQPIPFSMFTTNSVPLMFGGQPEYSQPNGIPMAGKEFMDTVFTLKPGEAGVALDQPHNVVYVIHVLGDDPSLEIRREMFVNALQRGTMSDLMAFASIEKRGEIQSLFNDLEKHFNVKWARLANMGRGDDE